MSDGRVEEQASMVEHARGRDGEMDRKMGPRKRLYTAVHRWQIASPPLARRVRLRSA